jgi:hypothetical protein
VVFQGFCLTVIKHRLEAIGCSAMFCRRFPYMVLYGPCRVLEHDSIAIEIFERLPLGFPIWVIRSDTLKPRCEHASTTGFPLTLIGQVEHQQVILRRRCADVVSALGREFQMVGLLGGSKDDAVEAMVVFKLGEGGEAKPCGIHLSNGSQMVSGAGDAEHSTSLYSSASSPYSFLPWLCSLRLLELKCHRSGTGLAVLELSCSLGKMVVLCHNPGLLKIHHDKPCCSKCLPIV